jgi:hypothetical protein
MLTSAVTMLLCLVVVALPSTASVYDAAADFSIGSNPNGAWSYGWSSTLGSAFVLSSSNTTVAYGLSGLSGWFADQTHTHEPAVVYNGTANPIFQPSDTTIQPGQLALAPGGSPYSIVRWTAPSAGLFSVTATFSGLSTWPHLADVHILQNGNTIFSSTVGVTPDSSTFSGLQNLAQGDTIDFAVGWDSDGSANDDTTALSASIQAVPEPTTLGLVGAALGCLLSLRILKRK